MPRIYTFSAIITIIVTIQPLCKKSSPNPLIGEERVVIAKSGLNVREKPNLDSKAIDKIYFLQKVEIIDAGNEKAIIDNISDFWFKVKFQKPCKKHCKGPTIDKEGWIFGGFIKDPNSLNNNILNYNVTFNRAKSLDCCYKICKDTLNTIEKESENKHLDKLCKKCTDELCSNIPSLSKSERGYCITSIAASDCGEECENASGLEYDWTPSIHEWTDDLQEYVINGKGPNNFKPTHHKICK